jgi:hypothetical protein
MMSGSAATILAALIGAMIGSVGSIFLDAWLRGNREKRRKRDELVQRYLLQLQDAMEGLWYRIDNLARRGGRKVMEDRYFEISTLYALGRVIAYERILLLDGVYPQLKQIDHGLSIYLKEKMQEIGNLMSGFHKYDQLALAEAVIQEVDGYSRAGTYLEFKRRYDEDASLGGKTLLPAKEFLATFAGHQLDTLLKTLAKTAKKIAKKTEIPTTVEE